MCEVWSTRATHWARECDQEVSKMTVKGVGCRLCASPTCIYVRARFQNKLIRCLLDSGCDHSVIGRKYVQNICLDLQIKMPLLSASHLHKGRMFCYSRIRRSVACLLIGKRHGSVPIGSWKSYMRLIMSCKSCIGVRASLAYTWR